MLSSLLYGFFSAFREIRSQPLRSILSMAGVALAVAALTALLTIVTGLKTMVTQSVVDMGGAGRLMVQPQTESDLQEKQSFSRSAGLRYSDGDSAEAQLPGVSVMNTAGAWEFASYLGQRTRVYLMGSDRDYLIRDVQAIVLDGAMPAQGAFDGAQPVAMVGGTLAQQWDKEARSRGRRLVGSRLDIGLVAFTVACTYRTRRSDWGRNAITVAIPWNTYERFFQGKNTNIGDLQLRIEDPDSTTSVLRSLRTMFLGLHRGAEDFLFQQFDFLANFTAMIGNIALLFYAVAGLSLSVGALGIFNTMLAGLNDRIREIGVRKALGSRQLQIAAQFLMESIVLCSLGGIVGLGLGSLPSIFGAQLEKTLSIRPEFTLLPVLSSLGLSVAVGVLAGLYPAIHAGRLSPIDALRYE